MVYDSDGRIRKNIQQITENEGTDQLPNHQDAGGMGNSDETIESYRRLQLKGYNKANSKTIYIRSFHSFLYHTITYRKIDFIRPM